MAKFDFPKDFNWGTASASYQVEGGAHEDGKGPSIWTEFEKRPGSIFNGDNGDVASDQYHHWKEDVELMKYLGLRSYRFSMAWSRVFPEGRGALNVAGLDYYKRLCDALLENGIEPFMTFYHWDLPLALQKEFGGWESRETVKYFGEYVERISMELKGRVKNYFTTNEFLACSDVGYGMGSIAPGLKLPAKRLNQVRHHVLLAHGTALAALRATSPEAKVGLAENPWFMVPLIDTPEHVEAAKLAFREENAHFLTAIMEGKYLDCYLEKSGADAPVFTDDDMKTIGGKIDMLGLNIYFGKYVCKEDGKPYRIFTDDIMSTKPGRPGLYYEPDAIYWGARIVTELWNVPELIISENGTAMPEDNIDVDSGRVYDLGRIKYLRNYLTSMARAISEGYPIKGYFHWSIVDNLEWNQGFTPRFGLTYIDFHTLKRTLKMSGEWYRELIRTGRIV
ncbi:MAG: beta-glucosidase [Victivallales bacterium]|nr:beta-glucosidase [Victivallales bacterium]